MNPTPQLNLSHITFTGVDAWTDLSRCAALSREFPLIEWGFLYSPKQQGLPGRYPSVATLQDAFTRLPPQVRVALHVCDAGVSQLLDGEQVVTELVERVERRDGRIQLNFNQARKPVGLGRLRAFVKARPNLTIITQHHDANAEVLDTMRGLANHAVLFDRSGGQGIAPAAWPKALPGLRCGYAGGLGPDTIAAGLQGIATAAADATLPGWIDMEGRLRVADAAGIDWLSLDRCESVAREALAFLDSQPLVQRA